jgi:hypothetical protein
LESMVLINNLRVLEGDSRKVYNSTTYEIEVFNAKIASQSYLWPFSELFPEKHQVEILRGHLAILNDFNDGIRYTANLQITKLQDKMMKISTGIEDVIARLKSTPQSSSRRLKDDIALSGQVHVIRDAFIRLQKARDATFGSDRAVMSAILTVAAAAWQTGN